MNVRLFFSELKRRHVFRVAVVYTVVAWVVIQVAVNVFPALHLPEWTVTLVVILSLLGFPVALVLGWAFDITPDGVERTEPRVMSSPVADSSQVDTEHASGRHGFSRRARPKIGGLAGNPLTPGPTGVPKSPRRAEQQRPHADTDGPEAAAPAASGVEAQTPDPDRVKRASLAYLRHELRTPVNAVIGYSEMLIEDATAPERILVDLRKIHVAGKEILSIIDDILQPDKLSTARAGEELDTFKMELRHALRTPLNAVIGYSEMLIENSRETENLELLPDLQRILDAAKQLLGLIHDIVQLSAPDTESGVDRTRLSVASVMAQEVLAKIQPLDVDPAHDAEVHEGCLLVVDDNAINRELLSRQLARQGYSVLAAKNGREALDMIAKQEFDLVLLDIMMPDIDGFEVLRRLKSDETLRNIPVIMISALDEIDSVVRCIEIGAEDYLSKPFDPVLLRARIGANLNIRRLRNRERSIAEQLGAEQAWSDRLLRSLFPAPVVDRFREGETEIADLYPEATALCADLDGFGRLAAHGGPEALVDLIGEMFSAFDRLAEQHGLETTKMMGHTYLAVGGVPNPRHDHAEAIGEMALGMLRETARYAEESSQPLCIRIGIHTGPVVAGVPRSGRFTYDVWGDAVDTADGIKVHCAPGSIQVSPAAYSRLRNDYAFESRGVVEVAGKGQMRTYLLQGRTEPLSGAV